MNLRDLLKASNRNLLRNKLRTFLTIMAIFVGSFTLVLTNGISDGMRDYVEKQVKSLEGSNVLFVQKKIERNSEEDDPNKPLEYKERKQEEENQIDPNSFIMPLSQIESLAKSLPEVKSFTLGYSIQGEYITLDGEKKYLLFLGMLSEGITQKTEAGHTIDGENQILIPLNLARAFNENISSLIGKEVTIAYKVNKTEEIKKIPLRIVGVATKGLMTNFNSFVDSATARKIYEDQFANTEKLNKFTNFTLLLKSGDSKTVESVKIKLDEKGYKTDSFADRQKRNYDGIGIVQIILGFFAFIALLAASFGIINTLIVAVMERTKEIGLQKALGMGRWTIFALFSAESVLIGFWGAVAGAVGGILVGTLTNFILGKTYLESFEGYSLFAFKPFSIAWVILLVCFIAFLAGVMPAFRASRLNPIEALRYE